MDIRSPLPTSVFRSLVLVSLALSFGGVLGCGGGGARASSAANEPAPTSGSSSPAPATGQLVLRAEPAPPPLDEQTIAADAADPEVVVTGDSPWVVVPSFRMGVQLPVGWYRTTSDQIVENLRRSYGDGHASTSDEQRRELERQLRAAVDQHPADRVAMGLIPSVRVLLIPFGGVPPTDFCAAQSLQFTRQAYPDAQLTSATWTEVLGRRAARCASSMSANTLSGSFPGAQDLLWVFGESHIVVIASLGNASDPVSSTLDAVVASIRPL